jgi:hypothetical protein
MGVTIAVDIPRAVFYVWLLEFLISVDGAPEVAGAVRQAGDLVPVDVNGPGLYPVDLVLV